MKKIILIISLILAVGHIEAQSLIMFKFYDRCTKQLVDAEYELTDQLDYNRKYKVKDSLILYEPGSYRISVSIDRNGFIGSFHFYKTFEDNKAYTDTLELSKITVCTDSEPDNQYWRFHFCNRICNGHEVEYYENGEKCIEGKFKNGLPKGKIYYYDFNGKLLQTEDYPKRLIRINKRLPNKYEKQTSLTKKATTT
jgi:antitoxin component YwqK of YwqJK toxin-antitoxin module